MGVLVWFRNLGKIKLIKIQIMSYCICINSQRGSQIQQRCSTVTLTAITFPTLR